MPVFRSGQGLAPGWCEMEYFDVVKLRRAERHTFERLGQKEKLIVGKGNCRVCFGERTVDAVEGGAFDLRGAEDRFDVVPTLSEVTLVRMCGRWGDETGGCGVFTVANSAAPKDCGDPCDYPKSTDFDNHYHDCDEYWILLEGQGVAVSEGKSYEVGPGDCVATGMGHHHDFPQVHEPVRGVYFETTLEGRKRVGHLWEHEHGPAKPRGDRV